MDVERELTELALLEVDYHALGIKRARLDELAKQAKADGEHETARRARAEIREVDKSRTQIIRLVQDKQYRAGRRLRELDGAAFGDTGTVAYLGNGANRQPPAQ